VPLQRLFSTFATGWPGIGLLVQRLLIATALLCYGIGHMREPSLFALVLPNVIAAGAGMLLLVGLWTPVVGTVVAVAELWIVCSHAGDPWIRIILATLGATLAMIGPGAWSIDARLFGRKHIAIPEC
jgi:uncharacterized membrane protein YphA (DoxX/SURF4 family)